MSATNLTLKQTVVQPVKVSKKIFQVTKMTGNSYFVEHKIIDIVAAIMPSFKLVYFIMFINFCIVYFEPFHLTYFIVSQAEILKEV